jgi:glycosyltransferase involved in cell wall biosynthesis
MRILQIHNHYHRQPLGGEMAVMEHEAGLLRSAGHEVIRYERSNAEIEDYGPVNRLALPRRIIWASDTVRELRTLIRSEQPDLAHFHNTFAVISPAAYYACQKSGIPVVQTLHNYRLFCLNAFFFRDGRVCEDCVGKTPPWPGVLHACYHDSRTQSAGVAAMLAAHRVLRTWQTRVDMYIALTEFTRRKFIEGGLPPDKLVVKPNFVQPDPGQGKGKGEYALYVGRLSTEKGIDTLLKAWGQLGGKIPLKIAGDGPLLGGGKPSSGVEWLGWQSKDQVIALMKEAFVLIMPSVWYENFPVVVAEAYAVGLPIIASDLGSLASLVDSGRTGLHFHSGDPGDLAGKVEWLLVHPAEHKRMRQEARSEFEARYTPERNYQMLMDIYETALVCAGKRDV